MLATFTVSILAFIAIVSAEKYPRQAGWTNATYGPDGPWRAVDVQIAYNRERFSLYPGSSFETWVIDDSYCKKDKATCYASNAGTYNRINGEKAGVTLPANPSSFMYGVEMQGDEGYRYLDAISVSGVEMTNTSLVLLETQEIKYPGGLTAPLFAGCLSLGGRKSVNQTFEPFDHKTPVNASMPPGYMWENGWTSSNSFGMHIGSVQPDLSGSLWWGGYDENRIVGDVSSMTGGPRDGITLQDVGIEVMGKNSPFEFHSKPGLLSGGSSSVRSGVKVYVDGCSPYLTLPKSTCDNIAANLPVNFNEELGLYLWDTKSKKYKEIVSSTSTLAFSFISKSNTDPFTIRVPFMHLNLTLSEPLVPDPIPYFPCHVNNMNQYVLGRAFLQDAFIGANWHPDVDTWWLAQAPGPNIPLTPRVITIGERNATISRSENDWKASWEGVWSDEKTPTEEDNSTATPEKSEDAEQPVMPLGAKIGIGVGAAAVTIALIAGAFFFWRRRKTQKEKPQAAQPATMEEIYNNSFQEWPQNYPQPPQELHVPAHKLPPYEMPDHERRIFEMYAFPAQQKRPLTQRYEMA
ncbi:aspartic peptidase domain-containing protein [Fusarium flagelliforme]|uniref:Peptidase A1 domain-containing protein n=1 Tax=Fusarium flagelliforme TaxID=2675880 RepID=A0A395N4G9_9HYPO|nr:aspartic peptidase domain-containing protein [Fusarium flagelliforme]KAH7183167.1 aspartic peptidase domain-containing protein [Fusarium flagelliforme]RFN55028.1 hypothetical protein FIE12Z_711 [Fusarium flagelliforme]